MASTFTFETDQKGKNTTFSGPKFYEIYKDSRFLRVDANVESLLARGYEVRQKMKNIPCGDALLIEGMNLEKNTPLLIKKTGKGIPVEDFEFTYNRLMGLVAAYVYENRHRFPIIESSDAKALGLVWNNENEEKCKLYLSAVSGTENMINQFSFFPLLCGMRRLQLKKIPTELVVGMAYVKNNEGVTMAKVLKSNLVTAKRIWSMFPGSSVQDDIETLVNGTPKLKTLFQG